MASNDNTGKIKKASALAYEPGEGKAPRVIASGRGEIAEKIIELAHEYGIPIKNDPELAQVLGKLKPGSEIPVELYRAVAEILAFVYSLNEGQRPKTHLKS